MCPGALAALAVAVLVVPSAALPQVTYYLSPSSGADVGADGTTNLPSGAALSPARALLASTAPSGSTTAVQVSTNSGNWLHMGRFYGPTYSAVTQIGANAAVKLWLVSSSPSDDSECGTPMPDSFRVRLYDYDPAGLPANGALVGESILSGLGWAGGYVTATFPNAAAVLQPGHRLVLSIDFAPAFADGYCGATGAVGLGSTAAQSTLTISETTLCTPSASLAIPAGQSVSGTPIAPASIFTASGVSAPTVRFGVAQSDAFATFGSRWTKTDVGGDAAAAPTARWEVLTAQGKGAGLAGTADQFTYLSQPASFGGDFTIDVRVPALGAGGDAAGAQAGIVVRQDATAGAPNAAVLLTRGGNAVFQTRVARGGSTSSTTLPASAPQWLRLARSGGSFVASVSADGQSWTQVGTRAVPLSGSFLLGLAVSSARPGVPLLAQFARFVVTEPALGMGTSWADPATGQPSDSWPHGTYWLAARGTDATCGTALAAMGSFRFSLATTTVGDNSGTESPDLPRVCPSLGADDAPVEVDRFTLATSAYGDAIGAVELSVTGATAIQQILVTSDDGATVHGRLTAPGAAAVVPLDPPLAVGTTPVQLRVKIRPAIYGALASGTETAVRARVTGAQGRNDVVAADASGALAVVDRKPPADPVWGISSVAMNQVQLAWTNPSADLDRVVLLRSAAGGAVQNTSLTAGATYVQGSAYGTDTAAYVGQGETVTDVVEGGLAYTYRIFASDACRNHSAGSPQGPFTPTTSPTPTTVASLTATPGVCAVVALQATFTNDGNRNNSVAFSRGASATGPFSSVSGCVLSRGFGSWSCTDASPTSGGVWWYRAAFADPDGFAPAGASTIVSAPVPVERCPSGGGALTLTALGTTPDATAAPGDASILAARFRLSVSNSTVDVARIVLDNGASNPVIPSDLSEMRLYEDLGTPGVWDASDVLVAGGYWDTSRQSWVVSPFTVTAGTHDYLLTVSVRYGTDGASNRKLLAAFSTQDIAVGAAAHLAGDASVLGGTITISGALSVAPVGDPTPDSTKPMLLIVNPKPGSVSTDDGGRIRVQVQVHDPSGTGISSVMLSRSGGASGTFTQILAPNSRYPASSGAAVYDAQVPLETGSRILQAQAVNGLDEVAQSPPVFLWVNPIRRGDGNLLRRDNSSQLCSDCHALETHSSRSTANPVTGAARYGAWAVACRDCHEPHETRNVQLVREKIVPPPYAGYQPARTVRFWDRSAGDSGDAAAVSFVTSSEALLAAGTVGPCQACHTRTSSPDGVPRWRSSGNSDDHFTAARETTRCTTCHAHETGFGVKESKGGKTCDGCHAGKLAAMQPGARRSAHVLGSAGGALTDGLSWGDPLVGPSTAPSARSCVSMCHPDHAHNDPAAFPAEVHANDIHRDATSTATRALSRDTVAASPTYGLATAASTGAGTVRADHVAGQAQGCLSCHQRAVDPARPAISGAAYDSSAHGTSTAGGVAWEYVVHDDTRGAQPARVSRFERNCTKCHASTSAEATTPSWAGTVQGAHASEYPSLLGGEANPAGSPSRNACYGCHGNGTVGKSFSNGKDVATASARAEQPGGSGHRPDFVGATQHDSHGEAAMSWGDPFAGGTRHAGCLDCHAPHRARAGRHATPGSAAGPGLEGALGAKLSTSPPAWTAPGAGNFTPVTIQAGADLEATLCFRCHSSFAWGSGAPPTSPSLGAPYTDQAKEFNPNNVSFHPVLADASANWGRIDPRNLTQGGWNTAGRNRMTCSDCHASSDAGDVGGPHGSSVKFVLKGPNTRWDTTATIGDKVGVFCFNCHDPAFAYTRSVVHTYYNPTGFFTGHQGVPCQGCHAAVPHGGPRPGMLVDTLTRTLPGWDDTAPYNGGAGAWLEIVSYPQAGGTWEWGNCSCEGGHSM